MYANTGSIVSRTSTADFVRRVTLCTEDASMRAQLLCLDGYLPSAVASNAYQTWTALSRASHHHPYELAPTLEELLTWCQSVEDVLDATERAWVR